MNFTRRVKAVDLNKKSDDFLLGVLSKFYEDHVEGEEIEGDAILNAASPQQQVSESLLAQLEQLTQNAASIFKESYDILKNREAFTGEKANDSFDAIIQDGTDEQTEGYEYAKGIVGQSKGYGR